MPNEFKPDLSCVPYRRKGLYFALTIPFLILLMSIFVYLWTFSFLPAMVYLLFYIAMCYFQAYCCAYQDCPYVGGFCPAIIGIYPANLLAKTLYKNKALKKSKAKFELNATLGVLSWLSLVAFPVYWLAKLGVEFVLGYVAGHAVYAIIFSLTVCPVCSIRLTCPGGKLQSILLKRR